MTCVDLNFFGAIHTWSLGQKLDGMCLHGINVVWIARAAKFMAFLAAGTILIDIVGPQKAVVWAVAMRRRISRIGPKAAAIGDLLMRGKLHPSVTRRHITIVQVIVFGTLGIAIAFRLPEIAAAFQSGYASGDFSGASKAIFGQILFAYLAANFVMLFAGAAAFSLVLLTIAISYKMLHRDFCERARIVAAAILCAAFVVDMLMS